MAKVIFNSNDIITGLGNNSQSSYIHVSVPTTSSSTVYDNKLTQINKYIENIKFNGLYVYGPHYESHSNLYIYHSDVELNRVDSFITTNPSQPTNYITVSGDGYNNLRGRLGITENPIYIDKYAVLGYIYVNGAVYFVCTGIRRTKKIEFYCYDCDLGDMAKLRPYSIKVDNIFYTDDTTNSKYSPNYTIESIYNSITGMIKVDVPETGSYNIEICITNPDNINSTSSRLMNTYFKYLGSTLPPPYTEKAYNRLPIKNYLTINRTGDEVNSVSLNAGVNISKIKDEALYSGNFDESGSNKLENKGIPFYTLNNTNLYIHLNWGQYPSDLDLLLKITNTESNNSKYFYLTAYNGIGIDNADYNKSFNNNCINKNINWESNVNISNVGCFHNNCDFNVGTKKLKIESVYSEDARFSHNTNLSEGIMNHDEWFKICKYGCSLFSSSDWTLEIQVAKYYCDTKSKDGSINKYKQVQNIKQTIGSRLYSDPANNYSTNKGSINSFFYKNSDNHLANIELFIGSNTNNKLYILGSRTFSNPSDFDNSEIKKQINIKKFVITEDEHGVKHNEFKVTGNGELIIYYNLYRYYNFTNSKFSPINKFADLVNNLAYYRPWSGKDTKYSINIGRENLIPSYYVRISTDKSYRGNGHYPKSNKYDYDGMDENFIGLDINTVKTFITNPEHNVKNPIYNLRFKTRDPNSSNQKYSSPSAWYFPGIPYNETNFIIESTTTVTTTTSYEKENFKTYADTTIFITIGDIIVYELYHYAGKTGTGVPTGQDSGGK